MPRAKGAPRGATRARRLMVASVFVFSLAIALLSGERATAGEAPMVEHNEGNILGTDLRLFFRQQGKYVQDRVRKAVVSRIRADEMLLSTYRSKSDLSRINAAAGGEPVEVSNLAILLLRKGVMWNRQTKGVLDMTIGPLARVWEDARRKRRLPGADAIAAARSAMGIDGVVIDVENRRVGLRAGMRLDVDAFAKGFIVDRAAAVLRERGVSSGLVEIGGDLYALGGESADTPWEVAVQDPRAPQDPYAAIGRLRVKDRGVATSGVSFETFTIDGKSYSHLLDPRSGRPASEVSSTTVIARTCEAADAIATVVGVLGVKDALAFLERLRGVEGVIVTRDAGRAGALALCRSSGFSDYEVPGSFKAALSPPGERASAGEFPSNRELLIRFRVKGIGKKPYVAVWVEEPGGRLVKTLLYHGVKSKYQKDLGVHWNKRRKVKENIRPVTKPTRRNGVYAALWDGRDHRGKRVPAGEYVVRIEVYRENFLHLYNSRAVIRCADEDARAVADGNTYITDVGVVYRRKGR